MSSFIKKYNVGNISLDLPYNSFIHELPLLGFSDMKNSYNFSLVFNHKLKLDLCNVFTRAAWGAARALAWSAVNPQYTNPCQRGWSRLSPPQAPNQTHF